MNLAKLLIAAFVSLVHVFTPFKWTEVHTVEDMLDAHNVYPCHLLSEMDCLEGMEDSCGHDLRTKWHGPACFSRDGKPGGTECGDCVLMYAGDENEKELASRGHAHGKKAIREYCGIPCKFGWRFK